MGQASSPDSRGLVVSLHLHSSQPGAPLTQVDSIDLVEGKGIAGDIRYFGRVSRDTGKPSLRQVSLIETEQIAEHAAALGLEGIPPGAVRSNIETAGIKLVSLIGSELELGEALLFVYAPRDPCEKMDAICHGLRERMLNNRQGVMAQVLKSGRVKVGDPIRVRKPGENADS